MWKLLSDTRRACLRASIIGTGLVFLLVMAETVSGKLEGAVGEVWLWSLGLTLPALAMLWFGTATNRYPTKLVAPGAHVALVWGSFGFQFLAFLTLLLEPLATRGATSIVQFLTQSLWWLLPFELLLLLGFGLVFYRKDSVFKPNSVAILDFAKNKAADWGKKGNTMAQAVFRLVAENHLTEALAQLRERFEQNGDADGYQAAILFSGQFQTLSRERDLNTVEPAQAQIALNRITMGVLNLADNVV